LKNVETKQFWVSIDFHCMDKTTTDVNVNGNCLVIFFYVQQKTEMHTGLE